jgi:hypothetical protein
MVLMVKQVHDNNDQTKDLEGHNLMAQSNDSLKLQLSSRTSLNLIRTEDACLHPLQTYTPPPGHLPSSSSSKTLNHSLRFSPFDRHLQTK